MTLPRNIERKNLSDAVVLSVVKMWASSWFMFDVIRSGAGADS